jgi:ribosome-associated protein
MQSIAVTDILSVPSDEIHFTFVHASGPGGQNVNKVATAAVLRFDIRNNTSLPPEIRDKLAKTAGAQVTNDGVLVIRSQKFRTQERNRQDAIHRLTALIKKASYTPKKRVKTKPTHTSQQKRLEQKKQRSGKKSFRKSPQSEE